MNKNLVWQSDDDGAYTLRGPKEEFLWILPRQPYCDRGHWELGMLGVYLHVSASLYFHHFEVAQREAELWLAKSVGRPLAERVAHCPDTWEEEDTRTWRRAAEHDGKVVECVLSRTGPLTDPLWTWTIPVGLKSHPDILDASDAFPRHFLRAEHAVREVEAFLRWRLEKIPTVVPGRIQLPDEPVPEVVRDHITHVELKPATSLSRRNRP